MKNATYLSPDIENEFINIIGKDLILKGIICEIKDSQFFSILADKATSYNNEVYAFCIPLAHLFPMQGFLMFSGARERVHWEQMG